ncbi:metalloregulator ArsR/SmtB family transcription factor (plasmid) [Rossellomorea marisflavi]|uniref:ArsR/SmtB family transcription factor n=1 Tax=Rossellomorea marisflavi TaxID=189381 RepID=UPI001316E8D6|nr:metalloregulator ArsR/SmtB family transcription factor [Rossellomorea marisflavi]QHA38672.1 metalloregulator ArsR/SmtB family transcription factor [Rossellomorea marisflavi]
MNQVDFDLNIKVKFLQGFAHKLRIQILEALKEDEKTVTQLVEELNGSQSSISQHLSCLKGCGLIVGRQDGKYVHYRLSNENVRNLLTMFDAVLGEVQSDVACCRNHIV